MLWVSFLSLFFSIQKGIRIKSYDSKIRVWSFWLLPGIYTHQPWLNLCHVNWDLFICVLRFIRFCLLGLPISESCLSICIYYRESYVGFYCIINTAMDEQADCRCWNAFCLRIKGQSPNVFRKASGGWRLGLRPYCRCVVNIMQYLSHDVRYRFYPVTYLFTCIIFMLLLLKV